MLFASVIKIIFRQKIYIIPSLKNENEITILRNDSKRIGKWTLMAKTDHTDGKDKHTEFPLRESGLPKKFPQKKLLAMD